ncbi:MAG: D-alanine--D-alanine ligase [Bacteroidales bacterium]|nr:D-alanine--D-alanine ligase [Bacteroidales bacterium]
MKKKIALIAGGNSGEYPISIKSANMVALHIDSLKYEVFLIEIKGTDWHFKHPTNGKIQIDKNDFSLILDDQKIRFDLIFNMIHGSPGEDGKLQGYFDMLQIPYTSSNAVTSALTFNKAYCNHIVKNTGVAVSKNVHLFKRRPYDVETILNTLKLPVFVKPNQGGSSVGMSKVTTAEELAPAIEKAFNEDNEILIEEFVKGRELTCGAFEYLGKSIEFPVTEIISKKDFFDYEAKYNEKFADEITPAAITDQEAKLIHEITSKLYKILNCSGIVRFDFILGNGTLWFLEVNTVPGMSNASIIPQQVKSLGYSLSEFYTLLIEDALS